MINLLFRLLGLYGTYWLWNESTVAGRGLVFLMARTVPGTTCFAVMRTWMATLLGTLSKSLFFRKVVLSM